MKKRITLLLLLISGALLHAENPEIYEKKTPVEIRTEIDRLLMKDWKKNKLSVPKEASDAVWFRRANLALRGRLPSPAEARAYPNDKTRNKADRMIETALNSPDFIHLQTMYLADFLRVKSEFPINLWPNAVYAYHRRIHLHFRNNESYAAFARALLCATGSNFRIPEVNFYRAIATRSPEGIADAVTQTFLGKRLESFPSEQRTSLVKLFSAIRYKNTREWKEEIVYPESPAQDIVILLPDGTARLWKSGQHPGEFFADWLLSDGKRMFARTVVQRIWTQFFARGFLNDPEDSRPYAACDMINRPLFEHLTERFIRSDYRLKELCKDLAKSAAFRASSLPSAPRHPPETDSAARSHFARFPMTRLPAEVLEDAICDITGTGRSYSSVIPEPFTFLPSDMRTVTLADGSISNSFLILFGRPARDTGSFSERKNDITPKQRQFLFNSGDLFRRINRIQQSPALRKLPYEKRIEMLYLLFYGRPPADSERAMIQTHFRTLPNGRAKWNFMNELSWVLMNSNEFLIQH